MTVASQLRSPARPVEDESVADGVHVRDLRRRFGTVEVLHGISFDVPQGSVCTLLGASGSGKTTTLRLLAGLDRPDGGEIFIGGRRVAGPRVMVPAERREVGLVFQSYALWPHMTMFDQIAYPLRMRRVSKAERRTAVEQAADMVGLRHLLDRYPSQLSGGQQQRVALARALVFGPRLLLLDEPLSGLDAALRRQTRLELEQVQARVNVTTIYVTHDQEEAMSVSDFVIVMSDGDIVSIAPPRQIYDRPDSVYVASFVGGSNLLDGTVVGRDGENATVRLGDGSLVAGYARPELGVGDDVTVAVKPCDVGVESAPGGADGTGEVNVLAGRVTSLAYLGPQVELCLSAGGSTEFRVPVTRGQAAAVDDVLQVRLDAAAVTVLPADRPGKAEDDSEQQVCN